MPPWTRALAFAACLGVQSPVAAQPAAPAAAERPHVRVALVTDADRLVAGEDAWLGVRFVLEDGWHVYWQNPGDSGMPPQAAWEAPPGVHVGPFQWPAPRRLEDGPIVNYGYEGDVVLPASLRVDATARPRAPASVSARVKWLVCRDICLPGEATLALVYPRVPADDAQADRQALRRALDRVPRDAPPEWRARASSSGRLFVVTLETGRREDTGAFFPLHASQIDDGAGQQVEPLATGVRFTLRKSDQLAGPVSELAGIVSLSEGRTFVIRAPVTTGTDAVGRHVNHTERSRR